MNGIEVGQEVLIAGTAMRYRVRELFEEDGQTMAVIDRIGPNVETYTSALVELSRLVPVRGR